MANETNVVGNVSVIEGVAFAQNKDGTQRQLQFGDPVFEGEVVVTATGGRVELSLEQGGKLLLRSQETVTLDSTVFDNVLPNSDSAALLPRIGELTVSVRRTHLEIAPRVVHRVHDEDHAHHGERGDRPNAQETSIQP